MKIMFAVAAILILPYLAGLGVALTQRWLQSSPDGAKGFLNPATNTQADTTGATNSGARGAVPSGLGR